MPPMSITTILLSLQLSDMAADTIGRTNTEAQTFTNGSFTRRREIEAKRQAVKTPAEFALWRHESDFCEYQGSPKTEIEG